MIKTGKIKRYDKARVDLHEIIKYRQVNSSTIAIHSTDQNKKTVNQEEPPKKPTSKLSLESDDLLNEARAHKAYFDAMSSQISYEEKKKVLINLQVAKGIVEEIFDPAARKLGDFHAEVKSRFPDTPMEVIEWIQENANNIKKTVSENRWQQKQK